MILRLPLSVKILLWFFLNLALLVVTSLLLFNAEYHFNLDWLFAGNARQRVDTMRNLIVDDLNNTSPEEWDAVMDRYGEAYHVRFALYDDEGRHLIGATDPLPGEVRGQLPLRPRAAVPGSGLAAPSPPTRVDNAARALIHTQGPDRYWLLVGARVDNAQAGGSMRLQVVAEATSPGMGGLIIDLRPWLWLAAGSIVFSSLLWLPLLRGMTRAIRQVTDATRQIAEGRFDARVSSGRRDELGALSEAINQMAVRLDGLMRGQKRFLGDVAHELCSPLARLQLALGIIEQRGHTPDDRQEAYVRTAIEKAEQMARLVDQLLAFSRASLGESTLRLQPVNLRAVAEGAMAQEHTEGTEVRLEVPDGLAANADPELLGRAVANLLRNAIRHGGKAGRITVRAHGDEAAGTAILSLADDGPGVPEEELPKIFDAFYRVDTARTRETGGVGLGLSIVKLCVESCGGTVSARNRQPHGLEVSLHLSAAATCG